MKTISLAEYTEFAIAYHSGMFHGWRYGQAFMNHFKPEAPDPDLFYSIILEKSIDIIIDKYLMIINDV